MQIKIVDARPEDAGAIGFIQSRTWEDSYPNSAEGISLNDIKTKIAEWEKSGDDRIKQEMSKENSRTWVAKTGQLIIGFIAVHHQKGTGMIDALHILPKYQGRGIGKRLLQTGLKWLDEVPVHLQTVRYNIRAIEFYKSFGFRECGDAHDDPIILPGGKVIKKILMIRDL